MIEFPDKETFGENKTAPKSFFYRIFQLIGFLLGARFFVAILLVFALYVSTFFLFNKEENLRNFVFDFKVHGIILCTILTIFAGGIINHFYDFEKDHLVKPFRTRFQRFIKQKYYLYAYLALTILSLGIASLISYRVIIFFLIYQFIMWFYSHKLSRIFIINNLTFVSLTLYPFFGMLVYYQTFSEKIFLLAVFLFLNLLAIDITKDTLTRKIDKTFGYNTIPNTLNAAKSQSILITIIVLTILISVRIILKTEISGVMFYYFVIGIAMLLLSIYFIFKYTRNSKFAVLNILRLWIFVGIISMLLSGIEGNL
ncbi:prenyltransferase [Chryseobacterium sp. Leaf180]|uniref:UbiA family prenyltransferase n=1 Tax=Chryseobacterium sp. Leaf180 TaxID=1736289 RepID=UPI0006FBCC98|nr:UbiA family prenyltransferase [Chryseobacterium sp. Leaf180]KQR94576.1 prenyltransferase [Chryseobacterium sp. Leaf180]